MNNVTAVQPFKHVSNYMLLSGILAVILGVLMPLWPGISIIAASVVFGVYLAVSGIAETIGAFSSHISAPTRILMFISGVASLILAVLAFRHFGQGYAILLLAIWIGVAFIFRGVATTASAISEPGLPGRGWMIVTGIMSMIAGFVVLVWPFDSILILTLVVGVWLVVIGVFEIVSALRVRHTGTAVKDSLQAAQAA